MSEKERRFCVVSILCATVFTCLLLAGSAIWIGFAGGLEIKIIPFGAIAGITALVLAVIWVFARLSRRAPRSS